jgi:hypothetical protein
MDARLGWAILRLILERHFSFERRGVNFQITILKVLAGHPEGRVVLADLTRFVAILTSSGTDWSQRMKRLAARAPGLDIFTSGYVIRDDSGWRITEAGREFIKSIEAPPQVPQLVIESAPAMVAVKATLDPLQNVIQIAGHKVRRRRRAA